MNKKRGFGVIIMVLLIIFLLGLLYNYMYPAHFKVDFLKVTALTLAISASLTIILYSTINENDKTPLEKKENAKQFALRKIFFGSIRKKMLSVMIVTIVCFIVSSILLIEKSDSIIKEQSYKHIDSYLQSSLVLIDSYIYEKIKTIEAHGQMKMTQDMLVEEDEMIKTMPDLNGYLQAKNKEWESISENDSFAQEILHNHLSEHLKELNDMETLIDGFEIFTEITILSKYGTIVASTIKTKKYYFKDETWWKYADASDIYISDIYLDKVTDAPSVIIAKKIVDGNGNFIGMAKTVLNLNEIRQIMDTLKKNIIKNGDLTLLTGSNQVIYSTKKINNQDYYGFQEIFLFPHEYDLQAKTDLPYSYTDSKTGENKYLFDKHSSGYKSYNGNQWILAYENKLEIIYLPRTTLENYFAYLLGIIILVTISINFYFSKKITEPIKELNLAAQELKKGNYKIRTNIKTNDEIDDLGKQFNLTADALGRLEEEKKELDKAKSELMSITSHELRSPMTPMKGQLQMLHEGYFGKLNKQQKEAVYIIIRNTDRLDRIILDFLEISRIEAAKLKFNFIKTNLEEPMNLLIVELKQFIPEKKIQLVSQIEKLPTFEVDPNRVIQVLRNLLMNAIKFSKDGGTVMISAKLHGKYILFSVKDNGIGIKKELQYRIFEPFFQGEQTIYRKYGGTGLGLAICKGIIESQNGKIWFESKEGKGTTFYFTVPLKPVLESKPIRLLIASKVNIEKRIEEIFVEYIGALADKEISQLRSEGKMDEVEIIKYIDYLVKEHIMLDKKAMEFKKEIKDVFSKNKYVKKV